MIFVILAGLAAACSGDSAPANASLPMPTPATHYPFSVAEPLVYSGKVFVTAGETTDEFFVARNVDRSRMDLHVGSANHTARVIGDREIVIFFSAKTYYEVPRGSGDTADLGESSAAIRGLFVSAEPTKFESLGTENGLAKFRVRSTSDERSENIVFVDEKAGVVMRQEFWTFAGETRTLVHSSEVRDFRLEAPDELFTIPQGFRKVSAP